MSRLRQRVATATLTLASAAAGLIAISPAAMASGADLGRISTTNNSACGGEFSLVQALDPAGATYGTDTSRKITSWSTLGVTQYSYYGGGYGDGTRALQVWRPAAGSASSYQLVFESARQSMTFEGVRSFDLAEPFTMQPGDRLGLEQTGWTDNCAQYGDGGLGMSFGPSVVGSTYTFNTAGYVYSLNIIAHVEPADATAPVVTPQVSVTPDGADGWYTSASPTVSFDVTDADSAVSDKSAGCAGGAVTDDTDGVTYECTATSAGGSATNSITIKRDATAPSATFDDAPNRVVDGASHTWGSVPAAPTCTAADTLSGPDGCTVTGYSAEVGTHTLTATASDKAGNTATSTRTYTVAPWRTSVYQPVDVGAVFNTVKNGSTVPVKFAVHAGATQVSDTSKVTLSAAKVTCATGAAEDTIEVTATGATSLRYDATAGQFIYNWATPKTAGVCYALTMTSADGTAAKALFKLK